MLGAEVVGVSSDDHRTQCDFAKKVNATFKMIGDESGEIARRYDVVWPFLKTAKRVTFLIDETGIIRGVFHHEIRVDRHVDDVIGAIRRMKGLPASGAVPAVGTPQKV